MRFNDVRSIAFNNPKIIYYFYILALIYEPSIRPYIVTVDADTDATFSLFYQSIPHTREFKWFNPQSEEIQNNSKYIIQDNDLKFTTLTVNNAAGEDHGLFQLRIQNAVEHFALRVLGLTNKKYFFYISIYT